MNYVIGMCKKNKQWITALADLGYNAQIIEQRITTSSGDVVKPDIVTVSNRFLHSIVFECKGGRTIDANQLRRYSTLTSDNLLRWITVFDRSDLQFDVCITDVEENHRYIKRINQLFPMFTFGSKEFFKTEEFGLAKLNNIFKEPISLKDKIPPLFYYPFCQDDNDSYIAIHVIRALLSIAIKNIKGGPDVFEENVISCEEIIAHKFNHVWRALSKSHRKTLKNKIREVIRRILAREGMKETLGIIQQKQGYKIAKDLDRFQKQAEHLIEEFQSQLPISDFLGQKS